MNEVEDYVEGEQHDPMVDFHEWYSEFVEEKNRSGVSRWSDARHQCRFNGSHEERCNEV